MAGFKALLTILPLSWNYLVLLVYGGFAAVGFATLYSSLLGVAIGLAVAASIKIFGSGVSDEGIHIGFTAGTLSAFFGLLSVGVLIGSTPTYVLPEMYRLPGYPYGNASSYSYPTGHAELWLDKFTYGGISFGWYLQGIMSIIFLIAIVLWCTRGSE